MHYIINRSISSFSFFAVNYFLCKEEFDVSLEGQKFVLNVR